MTDSNHQHKQLAALEKALLNESADPVNLPFSLLKAITRNFSEDNEIGRGGFGAVYKGLLPSGGIVAVKKLYEKLEILDKNFKREVACLVGIKHKNLVRFLGHCSETQHVMMPYKGKLVCAEERQRLLCFEYLPKGCLADYLSDASCRLQWTTRYEIIKGICEGVHYLHEQRIIHMDLKPQNVLLDDNMVPRIADFGLSRCLSESKSRAITKNMIGTKGYMAPEFINKGEITFKTDIYSLGVIIMEILMGHKECSNVKEVVERWTNKFATSKSQTVLEEVKVCSEIAVKCTNHDPGNRFTTCFIIRLFEKLCEVEISNRRDVTTSPEGQVESVGDPKRMCTGGRSMLPSSSSLGGRGARNSVVEAVPPPPTTANAPALPVDKQVAKIQLVQALLMCAEAVQQENLLAASQGGAMRRVAAYFGAALDRRVSPFRPQRDSSLLDAAFADRLHAHFYESCPYLKFAHFTANQTILEAFAGCRRVHVVDFGIKQGTQWLTLLQALALRPGGPPSFRLTAVGPPQPDETDVLKQVGWKLAQFAHTLHVNFEYRGLIAATLADLAPFMLQPEGEEDPNEEPEVIAVNSVFEMHRLLALPGALEKVLGTVHAVRPKIVTMVEQEANHNSGSFLDRFTESLHYYSAMFDSLEGAGSGPSQVSSGPAAAAAAGGGTDQVMSEVYLGRQICNVVACEGAERTERHETLWQWQNRLGNAGFETVHLGYNAYKQASTLLGLFGGADGYKVEEKEGCLTLGWHTRPLIATSAWRVAAR